MTASIWTKSVQPRRWMGYVPLKCHCQPAMIMMSKHRSIQCDFKMVLIQSLTTAKYTSFNSVTQVRQCVKYIT